MGSYYDIAPRIIRKSLKMSVSEKTIMFFIFDAKIGGLTELHNSLIAHECNLKEQTVANAVSRLSKMEYLTKISKQGIRLIGVTKENLGNIWENERESILERENSFIKENSENYTKYMSGRAMGRRYFKEKKNEVFLKIKEIDDVILNSIEESNDNTTTSTIDTLESTEPTYTSKKTHVEKFRNTATGNDLQHLDDASYPLKNIKENKDSRIEDCSFTKVKETISTDSMNLSSKDSSENSSSNRESLSEKNRKKLQIAILSSYKRGEIDMANKFNLAYKSQFGCEYIPSKSEIDNFEILTVSPNSDEENEAKLKGGGFLERRKRMKNATKEGELQSEELHSDAIEIIKYWENVGFKSVKPNYMNYTIEIIKSFLIGNFTNKIPSFLNSEEDRPYTKNEIIQAIENRKLKVFDNNYYPSLDVKENMKKIELSKWFYIPGKQKDPSPFLRDFYKLPVKVKNTIGLEEDINPAFTNMIKKIYAKNVLGLDNWECPRNYEDRFRSATRRFEEFKKENKNKLDRWILNPPTIESVARIFVNSAAYAVGNDWSQISPGWFSSDKQFKFRLPKYLKDQGLLTSY